ncbi:MAG: hypothetical protein K9W44_18155 [Candidatus Lokiarchaeota archaeon]|nr:hypothetical protein [Candidatus Harpocratesius repetitus]
MKLFYPPPQLFDIDRKQISLYRLNSLMIAVDQNKNLINVRDIIHPSIWISFWDQYNKGIPKDQIHIIKEEDSQVNSVLRLGDQIIQGLNYIMTKGYIFLGILTFTEQVQDPQILEDWGFFKRRKKYFNDLITKYYEQPITPQIEERSYVFAKFLGVGEKFFTFSQLNQVQIAQMSSYFHGNLHGVVGLKENTLHFMLLSQNISKHEESSDLIMDKRGRDILINLIKSKEFIPAAAFQFDYGISSLYKIKFEGINLWNAMELLPQYSKPMKLYQQYLQALIFDKPLPIKRVELPPPFLIEVPTFTKEERMLSPEELLEEEEKGKTQSKPDISSETPQRDIKDKEQKTNLDNIEKISPITHSEQLKTPELPQKPQVSTLKLNKISLDKPQLKPIKPLNPQSSSVLEEEYEDIFNRTKEKIQLFDENGKAIINPNEIDSVMSTFSEEIMRESGKMINPSIMTKDEIFKDLEASLKALSQLDELAQDDQAVSRIYYPPLSLISNASKEGMAIGGSTVIVSIGTGKNLWMVPEIKGTQMWGTFYKDSELSDQFEDFIALQEKEIESIEDFELFLQNAFVRIRSNNQVFLGICDFEANGFERNVFDPELMLDSSDLQKLMEIHQKKRENMQFPELEKEQWIEIRYYGNSEIIKFFTDPNITSILEIAKSSTENIVFRKGKIAGIVCLDEEAAYFFILSDNLKFLNGEKEKFIIDTKTLEKMYQMIEEMDLTPASFWRISFGFNSFKQLERWDEIKKGIIFPIIKENYEKYLAKLLEIKEKEDQIRNSAEQRFQIKK